MRSGLESIQDFLGLPSQRMWHQQVEIACACFLPLSLHALPWPIEPLPALCVHVLMCSADWLSDLGQS